jgi:sugar/nucleoside kinase (ribokinase family)
VAFIGVCGNDVFGRFMLDAMQSRGVDTSAVIVAANQQTGLSVILNRGVDRAILTHAGAMASLRAEQISNDLLRQTRHLHVASYFLQTSLQPGLPNLFQRARSLGLATSLDTNWDPAETWAGLDALLPLTSVFLPNAAEACAITRQPNVEAAARQLTGQSDLVAIKLGSQGALACQGKDTFVAASIPVNVVDTVGAGDTFDAGFLYGYLNGWDAARSLRLACVCGALSTQAAGGTDGQPTLKEAMNHVSG